MLRFWAGVGLILVSCAGLAATQPLGATASVVAGTPADLTALCQSSMSAARTAATRLKTLAAPAADVLDAYDSTRVLLGQAGGAAGIAESLNPDRAMRDAAETCDQQLSALQTEMSLDRGIYDALARIDPAALDPAGRYYLARTLQRFKLSGVDRDEPTRARVKQLNDDLTLLSQAFNRNIRESVLKLEVDPKDLEGLPADFLRAHPPGANGKVTVSTEGPDSGPVMSYARNASVREAYWKLYRLRAHPANLPVLDRMLARRHELATLLGFANWADYVTADKMIGNGRNAQEFIDKIAAAAGKRAEQDYARLLERKRKDDPSATEVLPWDSGYLGERIRLEQYGVDSQQVRAYFQFHAVKQAVFDVTSRMFGVRYERVNGVKTWHPDVEVYDVYEGQRLLGRFYLDMFPRADKYKHFAHSALLRGKAGVVLPESVLMCNFRQPTANDPGLQEYGSVRTFFHEFGHLLHSIFAGQGRWAGISGVATERDFVEAPSQMLEEWMRDKKTLQSFAVHYQTKQPMPDAMVDKLLAAGELGRGIAVRGQMSLAAISLGLHDRDPKGLDTTAFVAQMNSRYTPWFRNVPGTYFHEAFGHLDGYSAVYYTYQWSLVIAKDMFSEFRKAGDIMDPQVARRYRDTVLAPGGAKPAAELVRDFLGRPYSFAAYEAWLNSNAP